MKILICMIPLLFAMPAPAAQEEQAKDKVCIELPAPNDCGLESLTAEEPEVVCLSGAESKDQK